MLSLFKAVATSNTNVNLQYTDVGDNTVVFCVGFNFYGRTAAILFLSAGWVMLSYASFH